MPLLSNPFMQPHDLLADMDRVVINDIVNDDRSLQTNIGPSEMGCQRCVARRFMGLEKLTVESQQTAEGVPWLPYLGTQLHARLEIIFERENERLMDEGYPRRWITERRVPVIEGVEGVNETGSCDLFDLWTCTVIDHKLVGTTKLKSVRSKDNPGNGYRRQANVYGRGWLKLGYDVKNVAIRFYPRNAISLSQGYLWQAPFDEALAEDTIENVLALRELVDSATPAQYAAILERLPADPDCFSCGEYPELGAEGQPVSASFDQPTAFSRR